MSPICPKAQSRIVGLEIEQVSIDVTDKVQILLDPALGFINAARHEGDAHRE